MSSTPEMLNRPFNAYGVGGLLSTCPNGGSFRLPCMPCVRPTRRDLEVGYRMAYAGFVGGSIYHLCPCCYSMDCMHKRYVWGRDAGAGLSVSVVSCRVVRTSQSGRY